MLKRHWFVCFLNSYKLWVIINSGSVTHLMQGALRSFRVNGPACAVPPTPFRCRVGLCPTISATSWNRRSDFHAHFTLWLASCAEVSKEPGFELLSQCSFFFHSVHNHFCHFSCVQPDARLWMSSRRDRLTMCTLILIFKRSCVSPLYDGRLFTRVWLFGSGINTFDERTTSPQICQLHFFFTMNTSNRQTF